MHYIYIFNIKIKCVNLINYKQIKTGFFTHWTGLWPFQHLSGFLYPVDLTGHHSLIQLVQMASPILLFIPYMNSKREIAVNMMFKLN